MRLLGLVAFIGEKIILYRSLSNDEDKRSLGRHGSRWKDNTDVEWIEMAQEWLELVTAVMNIGVP
jgi:hypothetical protein